MRFFAYTASNDMNFTKQVKSNVYTHRSLRHFRHTHFQVGKLKLKSANTHYKVKLSLCIQQIFICQKAYPQSTYICRVQGCVWRLPKHWPPTPLSTQRVCPTPAPKAGGGVNIRWAVRGVGGGQYFGRLQTLDWPLTVCRLSSGPQVDPFHFRTILF